MSETAPTIVPTPEAAMAQKVTEQAAFTVVDKRSSATAESHFPSQADIETKAATDGAQTQANGRVQEIIDRQTFKYGSRTVERGGMEDMIYKDAVAQAAREGHDVSHIFDAKDGGAHEADDAPIITPVKTDAVSTERIGKHSPDNPAVLPISVDSIKSKLAAEATAVNPFNPDGTPATLTLKDAENLTDDQKADLQDKAKEIGDKLSAEETAVENEPTRKVGVAKRIRALLRRNNVIEAPVADMAEAAAAATESKADLMDDLATHDADGGEITPDEVISDEEKAKLNAEDQERTTQQAATTEPVAAFNPDGTPASLSLADADRLTDEQREQLRAYTGKVPTPAAINGTNNAKVLAARAAQQKSKADADQRLQARVDYLRLGAPHN